MTLPIKLAYQEMKKLQGKTDKGLYFWFCPEDASGEPALLLDKKKIPVAQINEIKEKAAKAGKKKFCKGRVSLDAKEVLQFRVVGKMPMTEQTFKRGVKDTATASRLPLKLEEINVVDGDPDEDDEQPAKTVDTGESTFNSKLKGATAEIQNARKHPLKKWYVTDMMQDLQDKAGRGRYAEASQVLDELLKTVRLDDNALQKQLQDEAQNAKVKPETEKAWVEERKDWDSKADPKKFKQGKQIGKGGMGTVYLLESDQQDGPKLVLKTGNPDEMKHEETTYKKIGPHPNIARCVGVTKVGNQEGLVMEALTGGDVSDQLEEMQELHKSGALSEEEYWGVMQFTLGRTLEALAYMEQKGVVHADIKPPNIMLDEETGEPKLIDLGISVDTGANITGATPSYSPQEDKGSSKVDTFAVGASAFEVARGNTGKDGRRAFNYGSDANQAWFVKAYQYKKPAQGGGAKQALKVSDKPDEVFDKDAKGNAQKKFGVYGADTAYVDFVNWLTHPDPNIRPTPAEALQHPFMKQRMLDDDQARDNIKRVIASRKQRKSGTTPSTSPAPDMGPLRAEVASLLKQDLPKSADQALKLATHSAKIVETWSAKISKAKQGEKVLTPADLGKLRKLEQELLVQRNILRGERDKVAEAGTKFGPLVKSSQGLSGAELKQAQTDQKSSQALSLILRKLTDALAPLTDTHAALAKFLETAPAYAPEPWKPGDPTLSASAWAENKKGAIKDGLKDEATGIGKALESYEKHAREYYKEMNRKRHATLLESVDKLYNTLTAFDPKTTWGVTHEAARGYRDMLLQSLGMERDRLKREVPSK